MSPPPVALPLAAVPPRLRPLLAGGAGAAAIAVAIAGDPPAATAAGGALAVLLLAAVAHLLRRRGRDEAAAPTIGVAGRRALSREAAVAILHVRGRALLVGYGPDGVRLLADLGPDAGGAP